MSEDEFRCEKCNKYIAEGTETCPECHHSPAKRVKLIGATFIVLGIAVSLTVIGAIIGIPVILASAYYIYKNKDRTAAVAAN